MENVIEIKKLSKKYEDFALKDISLSIPNGSIVGLIGENGAGKSTLIKALLGIINADYDELKLFDKEYLQFEKEIKQDIAVIFDETHFNQEFTPRFIGKILANIYPNWQKDKFEKMLEKFNLPAKKKLKKFSRGMKMKLEFAIALSHDAKLLILDEATSGLDPIVRDDILNMIRDFTIDEDHSVLISSHITSDLDKIADYIAYIHQGKLLFNKSYEELYEDYGIINGTKEILETLYDEDIVGYIKEPYSYKILVKNAQDLKRVYCDLEISRPTIEEIMLFYAKGVK